MLLVKSQHADSQISLDELMSYSLTPVPPSLGTADGFFNKTNKATLLHAILDDVPEHIAYPDDALFIQDGNAHFHSLIDIPPTFGELSLRILNSMVSKKQFIFSTDSYHNSSIKSQERLRRGCSQRHIVSGPATRKPADFKLFLANEDNKIQLCKLLLTVWSSPTAEASLKHCNTAILIVEGKAFQFTYIKNKVSN